MEHLELAANILLGGNEAEHGFVSYSANCFSFVLYFFLAVVKAVLMGPRPFFKPKLPFLPLAHGDVRSQPSVPFWAASTKDSI